MKSKTFSNPFRDKYYIRVKVSNIQAKSTKKINFLTFPH